MLKQLLLLSYLLFLCGCKQQKTESPPLESAVENVAISHANGFTIEKQASGITILKILAPWPNAEASFTYALIPKEKQAFISLDKNQYDAIISVPIDNIVVTSTTHIPALEALGALDKLVGFSDTKYVSSKAARKRIDAGQIKELGINESLNTEAVLALKPDLVVGFAVSGSNSAYETLQRSQIPVIYNGDWVEETPLGKAEWIKFFAPFFNKESEADVIFAEIEKSYLDAKKLAETADTTPTVLSGAMYKDVWYLPGGKSWAANFLKDANSNYLWKETPDSGSLSLSWENVLLEAKTAEYWIGPAQFKSYTEMESSSAHYAQFDAFKNEKVYTFANTVGETGGNLYYELAPQRPDIVLKDLIHILHPGLLPEHEPFFFKPLN
ncbi:iron complex transport system substrate-binding protein [Maribacter sedimenticola]|uniref:Iron complex transport system substrate-binding protein n=1 Tax=Maribacter sedimenticola TaxID=228956 RepID=A0ABY1SGJ7_9FLAO|nr:ABC transporter substrate-binding protein [Maribacter sedimenticola]SNR43250.1 iron complex transport system substrate-binding protein [Maribacter sedimenticola]